MLSSTRRRLASTETAQYQMATTTEDTVLLISSTEKSAEKAPTHAGSRSNHPSSSPPLDLHHTQRTIQPKRLPLGALLLERLGICSSRRTLLSYKIFVYALTFLCYMTYHLSRKPFSVVKVVLCPECVDGNSDANSSRNGWPPFEGKHAKTLLGSVDYAELFAYAVAMYFSGLVADRVNLRYFLTLGLIGSGLNVVLIGLAYFFQIHYLAYFLVVQVFGGVMQSTGLPGLVAVMGFWFGKRRRGLLLGLWNAHTAVGNILGTVIPSFWADTDDDDPPWGWAMIVPGLITLATAILIFLFLVTDPRHVGLPPAVHQLKSESQVKTAADRQQLTSSSTSSSPPPSPSVLLRQKEREASISESHFGGSRKQDVLAKETDEGAAANSNHNSPYPSYGITGGRGEVHPDREETAAQGNSTKVKPVGVWTALRIPGVIEYSLALFFNKLVIYTFLYWLPFYVASTYSELRGKQAYWLAALYDVGAIIGGAITGLISDLLNARAVTCAGMLLCAIPSLYLLRYTGEDHLLTYVVLVILCGIFISGPYAIITTAVSSDLGNHESLHGNQNAKATVTAFIDGTGSLGAATGPLIIGWITDDYGWNDAFYVLMVSCFLAALFLSRLVLMEGAVLCRRAGCIEKLRLRYRLQPPVLQRRERSAYQELYVSQSEHK